MPSGIITIGANAVSQIVPVPRGRTFTLALRGSFGASTSVRVQWYDGTNWNNFASSTLSLTAAGEVTGVNVGAINEILLSSTGNDGSTSLIAVVNVQPIEAHSM